MAKKRFAWTFLYVLMFSSKHNITFLLQKSKYVLLEHGTDENWNMIFENWMAHTNYKSNSKFFYHITLATHSNIIWLKRSDDLIWNCSQSQQRRTTIEKLTYLQNAKNTRSIVEVWPQVRKIGRSFGQKIDHFELC